MQKKFQEIANRLKSLREGRQIKSHIWLAKELDIESHRLYRIERGQLEPYANEILKYADYFGVSEYWILRGGETSIPSWIKEGKPSWSLNTLEEIFMRLEALENKMGIKIKKGVALDVNSRQLEERPIKSE